MQILPGIEPSGFPARTELVLAREVRLWTIRSSAVGAADPEDLTDEILMTAVTGDDVERLAAAAWLVGRSELPVGGLDLGQAVESRARALNAGDDFEALSYVEAQMSLALIDRSVRKCRRRLSDFARKADSLYVPLAAYYLAQLGDPAGWPAISGAARRANEQIRIGAARNLVGFLPYDGQLVDGAKVDVLGALHAGLVDPSVFVRREAPALIAEAAGSRARSLLDPLAASDDDEVRAAAQSVLEQLAG